MPGTVLAFRHFSSIAAAERRVSTDPKLSLENSPASPTAAVQPAMETGSTVLDSPPSPLAQPRGGVQLWLHRTSVFLFVLISAVAGVLLVILPWTPEWTDNYLLLSFPWLRDFVSSGFFRGLCSGLGLLDIWIGFSEALHYHEHK
ncbi:MAG: hypothetical protein WB562_15715 [Candidatus Sulfotelmatobacter sp.]